jgi:hypothetical protein
VRAGGVAGDVHRDAAQPGQALLRGADLLPQREPVPPVGGRPRVGEPLRDRRAECLHEGRVEVETTDVEAALRADVHSGAFAAGCPDADDRDVRGPRAEVDDQQRRARRQRKAEHPRVVGRRRDRLRDQHR